MYVDGWGGWIRTNEWRYQKPLPYHLATPHRKTQLCNKNKFQVFVNEVEVTLTQREFELLEYLIKNKGSVCTRHKIIEDVWDIHFDYDTGVIDVFMNAIRKKLNLTKDEEIIKTIRGIGYIAND